MEEEEGVAMWIDATEALERAVQELEIGELVHPESFAIKEAMAASELMDERMDAGVIPPGEAPVTASSLIASGRVKLGDFTPAELVAAIDDLWSAQASMLGGTMLVHSLFLWPQLHQPEAIVHPTLQAFAIGLLVTSSMMRRVIEQASIYREEDYVLEVGPRMPTLKVRTEDETAVLLAQCQRRLAAEVDQAASPEARALARALHARIAAMECLLRTVQLLRPVSDDAVWAKATAEAKQLAQHLQHAKETVALGSPAQTAGYHAGLLRSLSGMTPPRTLPATPRSEAYTELLALAEDLRTLSTLAPVTTLGELTRILDNLLGRKTAPGIYARSQARVMLFNVVNGTAALWHQHGFASVILPAELLAFSRATFAVMPPAPPRGGTPPFPAEMAEMVGQFLQFAAEDTALWLSDMCRNRARYRRRLRHIVMTLNALQERANQCDLQIHDWQQAQLAKSVAAKPKDPQPPILPCHLSAYVYHQKVSAMISYLWLGFELELYHPREYRMVLWYLDYLLGVLINNHKMVAQYVLEDETYRTKLLQAEKNPRKAKRLAADIVLPQTVPVQMFMADAMHEIARGLLWTTCVATENQLIPDASDASSMTSAETTFNHRFAPFLELTSPQPLTYAQYHESVDTAIEGDKLLIAADANFTRARTILTTLTAATPAENDAVHSDALFKQNLNSLMRVCIANRLAVAQCRKAIETAPGSAERARWRAVFDFGAHRSVPVVQVQQVQPQAKTVV